MAPARAPPQAELALGDRHGDDCCVDPPFRDD
jgi:hypothetical protein